MAHAREIFYQSWLPWCIDLVALYFHIPHDTRNHENIPGSHWWLGGGRDSREQCCRCCRCCRCLCDRQMLWQLLLVLTSMQNRSFCLCFLSYGRHRMGGAWNHGESNCTQHACSHSGGQLFPKLCQCAEIAGSDAVLVGPRSNFSQARPNRKKLSLQGLWTLVWGTNGPNRYLYSWISWIWEILFSIFFMLGLTRAFRLKPVQITFPRYDPDGIAKGDLSSAATAVSIDKYVSQDLSLLAPDVVELLDRFLPILIFTFFTAFLTSFWNTILQGTAPKLFSSKFGIFPFFPCVPKDWLWLWRIWMRWCWINLTAPRLVLKWPAAGCKATMTNGWLGCRKRANVILSSASMMKLYIF